MFKFVTYHVDYPTNLVSVYNVHPPASGKIRIIKAYIPPVEEIRVGQKVVYVNTLTCSIVFGEVFRAHNEGTTEAEFEIECGETGLVFGLYPNRGYAWAGFVQDDDTPTVSPICSHDPIENGLATSYCKCGREKFTWDRYNCKWRVV